MLRIAARRRKRNDSGYMLLVLMIAVAVLTITMLSVARNYRRSILRDREVEMIHRGEQYMRAVQRYYRKNGSYPPNLDALENTNKVRYLRKKYKDPMTPDGEWKPVYQTDVKLGVGGLMATGAQTSGNPLQANANQAGSAFMSQSTTNTATTSIFGSQTSGATDTGTQSETPGGTSAGGTAAGGTSGTATGTNTANPAGIGGNSAGPVLGGGPVLGVVSKSKAEGIHTFAEKSKYSEWLFIYDPSQDRGQQLKGPYNPNLQLGAGVSATQPGGQTGQPSSPGMGGTFGSAFGSTPSPGTTNQAPATISPQ